MLQMRNSVDVLRKTGAGYTNSSGVYFGNSENLRFGDDDDDDAGRSLLRAAISADAIDEPFQVRSAFLCLFRHTATRRFCLGDGCCVHFVLPPRLQLQLVNLKDFGLSRDS